MEPYCFFNGELMPVSQAKVGVYDIGLLRGFGVYEALRTFNRKPFMFSEHLARFHRSCEAMTLSIPESDERIRQVIDELIARNIPQGKEAVIRFILTGGEAIGGIELDPSKNTFYILVEELHPLSAEVFNNGCRLIVFEHLRLMAERKTTNYIQAVLLQEARKKAGALEILYTYQGRVLECATSNFFIVSAQGGPALGGKNVKIITPKRDVLTGVTRNVTVQVARKEFQVDERDVSVEEMYAADEAFLTSSFKDVVPVTEVDGKKIGDGRPGKVTKHVMELFHAFTQEA